MKKLFILLLLIVSIRISAEPTYTLTAKEFVLAAYDTMYFNVYLLQKGSDSINLSSIYLMIDLDVAFWNGGDKLVYIWSTLPNINMTCGMWNDSLLYGRLYYNGSLFYTVSNVYPGTLIARFQLVNRGSMFHHPSYIRWNEENEIPTTLIAWWGGDSLNITYPKNHFMEYNLTKILSNNTVSNYSLSQNYPNPFNSTTTINFQIKEREFTTLKVYNMLGKEVQTLVNSELKAGSYKVGFDAGNIVTGVYFYILSAGDFIETKKLILIK